MDESTIKEKVGAYLRMVYEIKDKPTMKRNIENMSSLYIENCITEDQKTAFFNELRFRLSLLTAGFKDLYPNRMRCLLLIVHTAVKVYHKLEEHHLFNFLTEFCKSYCDAISPIVRQYVCLLAGLIFSISVVNTQDDDDEKGQTLLSQKNYQKLFLVLKKRWLDKNFNVRKEAIRALANIQDDSIDPNFEVIMDCPPKEMILLSLGDHDPECRIEAIQFLSMKESRDFKHMLKVTQRDQDLSVQKEAIRRLADDMPYTRISVKERIDLIERLIAHPEEEVRNLLGSILHEWISQAYYLEHREEKKDLVALCAGSLYLLKHVSFLDNEQITESALFAIFERLLSEYQTEGEDAILALVEAFSDHNHPCMNRASYKKLLIINSTRRKAALAFHWHNLMAFCCSKRFPENIRADCRFKLAPEMMAYANFVQEFLTTLNFEDPAQQNQEAYKRFCLIQLLKIFSFLDQDPNGMQAWKDLLFNILASQNIELNPKLAEQIINDLMAFHFPMQEDTEVALNEFVDVLNLLVTNTYPDVPQPSQLDNTTRKHCLTIFNGMLKTGRFHRIGTILQSLYDFIVYPSLTSRNPTERILAYEAVGILSIFHEFFAQTQGILFLKSALAMEVKTVKLACIDCIGDIVLAYNYEKVAKWYVSKEPSEIGGSSAEEINLNELVDRIIEISDDSDHQLAFAGSETLIRWIFSENRSEWSEALVHLFLIYFTAKTKANQQLRALLSRFFPIFLGVSRANQLHLVNIFDKIMDKLRNRSLDGKLATVNEEEVALCIVKWTSLAVRERFNNNKKEPSVHNKLAKLILKDLVNRGDTDDYYEYIYCKMASVLKIDDIGEAELKRLIQLCDEVIPEISNPKNCRMLQQLHRKLIGIQVKFNM